MELPVIARTEAPLTALSKAAALKTFRLIFANSTLKSPRGRGGEDFLRGFKAENFSGPVVEQALDFVNLGRVEVQEGAGFGQVLPDQSVCVFIQAALPGVIGGGEIHRGFQAGGDFLMTGELLAIAPSE